MVNVVGITEPRTAFEKHHDYMFTKEVESDLTLSSPRDDRWFQSILSDDVSNARQLFLTAGDKEKHRLLNGRIVTSFNSNDAETKKIPMRFVLTRPLHATVILGSFKILKFMIEQGVGIDQKDGHSYNIIHGLVHTAHVDNKKETEYADRYKQIVEILTPCDMKTLLLMENKQGLRPLEMSCQLGVGSLIEAILLTRSVYLIKEQHAGFETKQYFDVTDYESYDTGKPPRKLKSPLLLLLSIDKSWLTRPELMRVCAGDIVTSWFMAKIQVNLPFIRLWLCMRVVFLMLFVFSDMYEATISAAIKASTTKNRR